MSHQKMTFPSVMTKGIRVGDFIEGRNKQTTGCRFLVLGSDKTEKRGALVCGFQGTGIDKEFIKRTDHFLNSDLPIESYIAKHKIDKTKHLPLDLKIKIITLSDSILEKGGTHEATTIGQLVEQVVTFTRKTSTLLHNIDVWDIGEVEQAIETETTFSYDERCFVETPSKKSNVVTVIVDTFAVFAKRGTPIEIDAIPGLIPLSKKKPSVLKSILQKAIRLKTNFSIGDEVFDAYTVARSAFYTLMTVKSTFNHRIKVKTRGLESAMKRLAISIVEDAYIEDFTLINSLLAGACIARLDETWYPSDYQIFDEIIHQCLDNNRYYDYRTGDKIEDVDSDTEYSADFFMAVHSIEFLRSFHSDIEMVKQTSLREGRYCKSKTCDRPSIPDVVPIYVAIDNHTDPQFILFMRHNHFDTFVELFHNVWVQSSSVNARRYCPSQYETSFDEEFINDLRFAQKMYWRWNFERTGNESDRATGNESGDSGDDDSFTDLETVEETITVPIKIFNGCIGSHEVVHNRKTYIVSPLLVESDELELSYHVIEKPTSRTKDCHVTEDIRDRVIMALPRKLPLCIPDSLAFMREQMPSIIDLDDLNLDLTFTVTIPVLPELSNFDIHHVHRINRGMMNDGMNGRVSNHRAVIRHIKQAYSSCFQRLLFYTQQVRSTLSIVSISRTGTIDDEYEPTIDDFDVFRVWSLISAAYPCFLRAEGLSFRVINSIALWDIFHQLTNTSMDRTYRLHIEQDPRDLYSYQIDGVNYLSSCYDEHTGSIIWASTGIGKTLMIASFLRKHRKHLPRYIVYVYPKSAKASIQSEFHCNKSDVSFHHQRGATVMRGELLEDGITFIEQDHLHKGIDILLAHASDILLVVDELHNLLNMTKRTSSGLRLTMSCNHFIGMTGTLIKDAKVDLLFPYLAKLVGFEITINNYVSSLQNMFILKEKLEIDEEWKERHIDTESDTAVIDEQIRIALRLGSAVVVVDNATEAKYAIKRLGGKEQTLHIHSKNPVNRRYGETVPPFAVVERRMNAGYNLTAYNTMIMGVYAMNAGASLMQLFGRIRRVDQRDKIRYYTVVHATLADKHEEHMRVIGLAQSLRSAAKNV